MTLFARGKIVLSFCCFHFSLPFVFLFYVQCFRYHLYLIWTVLNMHSLSMTLLEKVTEKKHIEPT